MKKVWTCTAMLGLCSLGIGTSSARAQVTHFPLDPILQAKEKSRRSDPVTAVLPAGVATDASNTLILSKNGRVGFFSAAFGDSVYAFDTSTGEILSSIRTGTRTGNLALFDDGKQRRLAVVNMNDPAQGEFATVSILDATDARQLSFLSAFILPPDLHLSPFINPVFDRDGARVVVASGDRGAIFLFDTLTGEMFDRKFLDSGIDSLAITHQGTRSLLGAVSASAHTVTIFEITAERTMNFLSSFESPFGMLAANNLCFNKEGTVGYLASFEASKLLSFDTATGAFIDGIEVGDSPGQIAATEFEGKQRIGVVNTGLNKDFLADSVSIIETENSGRFGLASVFLPPAGTDLTPDSTIMFGRSGAVGLVGALSGSAFMFRTINGEQLAEAKLDGQTTKLAINEQSKRLLVLSTNPNGERITVLPLDSPGRFQPPAPPVKTEPKRVAVKETPSSPIPQPRIDNVRVNRIRRGLRLTVEGEGFQPGAKLLINTQSVPTKYLDGGRLVARPSWGFIGTVRDLIVTVQNPDGLVSSQVNRKLKRRRQINSVAVQPLTR